MVREKAHIRKVRELASNPSLSTYWSRSELGMVLNLYKSTQSTVRSSKPGMHQELNNWLSLYYGLAVSTEPKACAEGPLSFSAPITVAAN